ncbi:MAG: 1-deoxy-D-xylulose-5-phosphate synthase [Gammaproteobacteria bacterium]|nr:1-deoxy-D-xylulose-5-phosphate synthase [Gammaproteobacteria bacterium]
MLLDKINFPEELRQLRREELVSLSHELREFIISNVARTGGHLSSNLGVVELTLAIHYVFQTPEDLLVWDVGHQSYPHKILTGRKSRMPSLRQWGGLAGFPMRTESHYDAFGTAHSSTSLSAALGMAVAHKLDNIQHKEVIAVIGDGALSAGMAFEALNNIVLNSVNLLIIINDNNMSISHPVGGMERHLTSLLKGTHISRIKEFGKSVLSFAPTPVYDFAKLMVGQAERVIAPHNMFQNLGISYYPAVNGHNVEELVGTLERLKSIRGVRILHVVTQKGNGYKLSETDPITYHGPAKFDRDIGIVPNTTPAKRTYSQIFGYWLCHTAQSQAKLVAITPAMCEGSGMIEFAEQYPERYFDVGIAEQHALTFATGLACQGYKPVLAIYSTFLQRAYDQLIHDAALQNLNLVLAIDRAGIVGADGPTHAGIFDMAFMRCVPNIKIACPANALECYQLLNTAFASTGITAVRYPRGAGHGDFPIHARSLLEATLPIGQGQLCRSGKNIALLAFGTILHSCLQVGEELDLSVANMRWVKPLDESLVKELARTHQALVCVEESTRADGAGSAVLELLQDLQIYIPVLLLGIGDAFTVHGDPQIILHHLGLDADGIKKTILEKFSSYLHPSNG